MSDSPASILVIEDSELNGLLMVSQLGIYGYKVTWASNGREGLDKIYEEEFDLVLLDLMMPRFSGFDVLTELRQNSDYADLQVLIISALSDFDSIVKSINLGANDYILKPINNTILRNRVETALEKKRRIDQEKRYLEQLEIERVKSEQLLQNIFPDEIAERLKMGEQTIADDFESVTVLFSDIVSFTQLSSEIPPIELVRLLNEIFTEFDQLAEEYGLEKIKTIGDGYMVVGGIPRGRANHAEAIARMALAMQERIQKFESPRGGSFKLRIGISSGPVVAGVIGRYKFAYDLWGDTVNVAKRMEEKSLNGEIHISEETYKLLNGSFHIEKRDMQEIKGKGAMQTYFLRGRKVATP
ncbi:MAG: response regulator [Sphaerospermopsis sp. SIO1G2]|nr:response regulator [Sphaerospermopsis sp. SIO1G2]